MPNAKKTIRKWSKEIVAQGAKIERLDHGKHVKLICSVDGAEFMVTLSTNRPYIVTDRNIRAQIKRRIKKAKFLARKE